MPQFVAACVDDKVDRHAVRPEYDSGELGGWSPMIEIRLQKDCNRSYAERARKMNRAAIAADEEFAIGNERGKSARVGLE